MKLIEHATAHLGLAEPPSFHEGQLDFLLEPLATNPRQEGHQRRRPGEFSTGGVRQSDVASPPRFDQSGHATAAAQPVFERVQAVVLDAASHAVDAPQAAEGF